MIRKKQEYSATFKVVTMLVVLFVCMCLLV